MHRRFYKSSYAQLSSRTFPLYIRGRNVLRTIRATRLRRLATNMKAVTSWLFRLLAAHPRLNVGTKRHWRFFTNDRFRYWRWFRYWCTAL